MWLSAGAGRIEEMMHSMNFQKIRLMSWTQVEDDRQTSQAGQRKKGGSETKENEDGRN